MLGQPERWAREFLQQSAIFQKVCQVGDPGVSHRCIIYNSTRIFEKRLPRVYDRSAS